MKTGVFFRSPLVPGFWPWIGWVSIVAMLIARGAHLAAIRQKKIVGVEDLGIRHHFDELPVFEVEDGLRSQPGCGQSSFRLVCMPDHRLGDGGHANVAQPFRSRACFD